MSLIPSDTKKLFKTQSTMKAIKARDLLAKRYGEKGSESREKFREDAYAYYFGEIIKKQKKSIAYESRKIG